MRHILTRYKASAEDKIANKPSLIDMTRARSIKRVDSESEIRFVLSNMHPDTKLVLDQPRSTFGLQQLLRMAPVSKSDLTKWVVYIVIYELPDGTVWLYIGSSTSREGSWYRLYKTYETAVRYLDKGVFHSYSRLSGAAQHMVFAPKGTKMHVRVLCSFDIPNDPAEYIRVKKIVLRTEAMFMDDFQAFPEAAPGETITIGEQKISRIDINTFSRSVAPPGESHSCRGVNRMHPFAMSFQSRRSVRSRADRVKAALAKQGGICRLDARSIGPHTHIFINRLEHNVPDYDDNYVCASCHIWRRDMDDDTRAEVKKCKTIEELVDIRTMTTRYMDIDAVYKHSTHCAICERPFESRPANAKHRITNNMGLGLGKGKGKGKTEGRNAAKNHPRWRTKIRPTARRSVHCLRNIAICCTEDSRSIESLLTMERRKKTTVLSSSTCDLVMLRKLITGTRGHMGKFKPKVLITIGERCGVCRCILRQMAEGERIRTCESSHDANLLAGGIEVSQNLKAKLDCLANVSWHVCIRCAKGMKIRTQTPRAGTVTWTRNISLLEIREVLSTSRAGYKMIGPGKRK
jgi:maleate cis-trans isomerase